MKHHASCDHAGVCLAKTPPCKGCDWSYAPGVIDGPHISPKAQRRASLRRNVLKALWILSVLAMTSAVLGFSVGYTGFAERLLEVLP